MVTATLALVGASCEPTKDLPTAPFACDAPATVIPGSDIAWGGNLGVDANGIYFTGVYPGGGDHDAPIWRATYDGKLEKLGSATVSVYGFGAAIDDAFYFAGTTTDFKEVVFSMPLAGGTPSILATFAGCAPYSGLAIDAANVYVGTNCADGAKPSLVSVPRGGGQATTLTTAPIDWVQSHDGVVYFLAVEAGAASLMRIEKQGPPTAIAHLTGAFDKFNAQFAFDDTTAYVIAPPDGVIAVPLDGSPPKQIASGLASPETIAADASGVYVGTAGSNDGNGNVEGPTIVRLQSGKSPVVMATLDKPFVEQLLLDSTTIYWEGLGHVGHVGKCVH